MFFCVFVCFEISFVVQFKEMINTLNQLIRLYAKSAIKTNQIISIRHGTICFQQIVGGDQQV